MSRIENGGNLGRMALALAAALAVVAGCMCHPSHESSRSSAVKAPSTQTIAYPIPYTRPATQQVMDVLERVRARLEANVGYAIVQHPKTREFIPDPTAATGQSLAENPAPTIDRGPEWKFSPNTYPMGVAYAGMLSAAEATGDPAFNEFVARRLNFFAENLANAPEAANYRALRRNPFRSLLMPRSLDECGAIGAAFIKARRAGVGGDLLPTINRFAAYISTGQHRLADGTLARERPYRDSIWGDDLYMSVPFLAQMGALTGDTKYYDDAARQIIQISQRLFVPSTGLFMHAWNTGSGDDHPHYYWGRANGWCMMAMVELLDVLPEDHPARPQIIQLLKAHARAVADLQSGSGLWHQMLDRNDSYLETSCSAMFSFALARAVNRGWLDGSSYGPVALAGWQGVTTRVTAEGHVEGVCVGTSYADDFVYYYARPAVDDVHGYGPVLLAGSEIIRLMANDRYKIEQSRGGPIYFLDKKRDAITRPIPF